MAMRLIFAALLLPLAFAGCERPHAGGVAVIDLDRVANAIGREKAMTERVEQFALEQEARLKQLQGELQQQMASANAKLQGKVSSDQRRSLTTNLEQARTQLTRELELARQSAQQLRMQLVREFSAEIQPVARREADARGLSIVVVKQPGLLVVAPEVDITNAVIDRIQSAQK